MSEELKVIIIAAITLLAKIAWEAMQEKFIAIWHTSDNFWWKCRASLLSIPDILTLSLKKAWKEFPVGTVINILIALLKSKMGFTPVARRIKKNK